MFAGGGGCRCAYRSQDGIAMIPLQSLTQNINDSFNYFVDFLLFEAAGLIQYDAAIRCKNTIRYDMAPLFESSGRKIISIN